MLYLGALYSGSQSFVYFVHAFLLYCICRCTEENLCCVENLCAKLCCIRVHLKISVLTWEVEYCQILPRSLLSLFMVRILCTVKKHYSFFLTVELMTLVFTVSYSNPLRMDGSIKLKKKKLQ